MKYLNIAILTLATICATAQKTELSATHLNFGSIPMKPRSERNVTLYNRTSEPVVIRNVKVDCNCTKIEWSKRPLTPGDSTTLKIIYTPTESGVFYKKIKITTNDSNHEIIIRGTVK